MAEKKETQTTENHTQVDETNTENVHSTENTENTENVHSSTENTENTENVHSTENTEGNSNTLNYEAELAEMRDKYTRLYAEFDNYRKRTNRERADLIKTAAEELIKELLPVLDDFERAEKSVQNSTDNKAQVAEEALFILHKRLKSTLEKRGLKPMENSIGKNLDADLHEAITQTPAPDESLKDKIIDEIEKGYYLHDKIIRFARVVVGV